MTRKERSGIEFPDGTWTTFDRYDRYGALARCLRASLGPGRHRVLDVGDAAGYLHSFLGDVDLIGLDLRVQPERLEGSIAVEADGARLPFPDRSFDAVISSDVLEHVPPAARAAFLTELSRVSADLVVVAAPFDTDGVAGVEDLVRRYAHLVTGSPQEQLEEHAACGLPDLALAQDVLGAHGSVAVTGNGNLWDWLELMLVKHQLLARPALQPLHDGIDLLSNLSMAGRAGEPPFYRHLVAARRSGVPELGTIPPAPLSPERVTALLTSLLVAAGPESTRVDLLPPIDQLRAQVGEVASRAELQALAAAVDARFASVDENLGLLRDQGDRVNGILDRLSAPLRRFRSTPSPPDDR
jgi:hypothetical protein